MNRAQRRALARLTKHRLTQATREKRTHRLAPEVCVLHVPGRGYVAGFLPSTFRVVSDISEATPYIDDEATSAALAFHEMTGLRVAIRPYLCPHRAH